MLIKARPFKDVFQATYAKFIKSYVEELKYRALQEMPSIGPNLKCILERFPLVEDWPVAVSMMERLVGGKEWNEAKYRDTVVEYYMENLTEEEFRFMTKGNRLDQLLSWLSIFSELIQKLN
jgi:hypothetical protein